MVGLCVPFPARGGFFGVGRSETFQTLSLELSLSLSLSLIWNLKSVTVGFDSFLANVVQAPTSWQRRRQQRLNEA